MNKTFIIAEAGVNHNGSRLLAQELIDAAVSAGADAVKFQTFQTKNCISTHAPKAEYQKQAAPEQESQYEMVKKLELSEEDHIFLIKYCQKQNIQFLSTAFDLQSIDLLTKFNLPLMKIASGEITNAPLLLKMARTHKPIILSTGMATLGDIESALGILAFGYLDSDTIKPSIINFMSVYCSEEGQQVLRDNITLLHCTTEYPAPFSEVNLKALSTLRSAFNLPVGYSDHTTGITIPIAAVACGATVIEKHFTIDRNLPGPDHQASLEPHELTAMINAIRQVELSIGNGHKIPGPSEFKNRVIARKSLVALCAISKGEFFTEANMGIKRPGSGISGIHYWDWLGKSSQQNYIEDELITEV